MHFWVWKSRRLQTFTNDNYSLKGRFCITTKLAKKRGNSRKRIIKESWNTQQPFFLIFWGNINNSRYHFSRDLIITDSHQQMRVDFENHWKSRWAQEISEAKTQNGKFLWKLKYHCGSVIHKLVLYKEIILQNANHSTTVQILFVLGSAGILRPDKIRQNQINCYFLL